MTHIITHFYYPVRESTIIGPNPPRSIIKQYTKTDTAIYVCDLFRPETMQEARELVDQYANKEPEILRKDFYNSLLAAFTPDEVRAQIENAKLGSLNIDVVSDRHMLIYGYI